MHKYKHVPGGQDKIKKMPRQKIVQTFEPKVYAVTSSSNQPLNRTTEQNGTLKTGAKKGRDELTESNTLHFIKPKIELIFYEKLSIFELGPPQAAHDRTGLCLRNMYLGK